MALAEADDKEAGHRLLHEQYLQGGLGEKEKDQFLAPIGLAWTKT